MFVRIFLCKQHTNHTVGSQKSFQKKINIHLMEHGNSIKWPKITGKMKWDVAVIIRVNTTMALHLTRKHLIIILWDNRTNLLEVIIIIMVKIKWIKVAPTLVVLCKIWFLIGMKVTAKLNQACKTHTNNSLQRIRDSNMLNHKLKKKNTTFMRAILDTFHCMNFLKNMYSLTLKKVAKCPLIQTQAMKLE